MTDCIGAVYAENEYELSWLIIVGAVYDENQTRQQCDESYKCGLLRKGN